MPHQGTLRQKNPCNWRTRVRACILVHHFSRRSSNTQAGVILIVWCALGSCCHSTGRNCHLDSTPTWDVEYAAAYLKFNRGLPRSNDTWSSAMTFTSRFEAVDSVGRTADWGASTWTARDVAEVLTGQPYSHLIVQGNITVFDVRKGELTFAWPPGERGALGAVRKAAKQASSAANQHRTLRSFRAGEVIFEPKWVISKECSKWRRPAFIQVWTIAS
jgi:hypothetical protein